MTKLLRAAILCGGLFLLAGRASAQGAMCELSDLQDMASRYIAAQTEGNATKLPLADFTRYSEQGDDASMMSDLLGKPLKIAHSVTFYDLRACQTFSELIVTDPAHPYVIATRLQFSGRGNPIAPSRVNEIESVITDAGDHLFDASATLAAVKAQDWAPIAPADRDSRDALIAAANAYLDRLANGTGAVPFAASCTLIDGGRVSDRCDGDAAGKVAISDRHFIVDDARGAVAAFSMIGRPQHADVHLFRIEKGKIRSIQSLTVCDGDSCGLPR